MNFVSFVQLFIFLIFLSNTSGEAGVDLSVPTTASDWKCLTSDHSVNYAIVRVYRSIGEVDLNGGPSIKLAIDTGIKDVGAYIFPCMPTAPYTLSHNITCDSAEKQVATILQNLRSNNIAINSDQDTYSINRIWLDIEDEVPSKYYDADAAKNQAFIQEITNALTKAKVPVGIYTTLTYWQNIMNNVEGYSQYNLWYPRYDSVDSLDFFTPFAGWEDVDIKQTNGDVGYCGISQVDSNYR
jgi:hypothetical protein